MFWLFTLHYDFDKCNNDQSSCDTWTLLQAGIWEIRMINPTWFLAKALHSMINPDPEAPAVASHMAHILHFDGVSLCLYQVSFLDMFVHEIQ